MEETKLSPTRKKTTYIASNKTYIATKTLADSSDLEIYEPKKIDSIGFTSIK
jgi:hypothetical protein